MSDQIVFLPPEDIKPKFVLSALSETQDWGLIDAHIDDAHKYTKGAGIKVAVLDTGYSPHDDIGSNVVQVMNRAGTQTADDHQGHGTHVCGIIAALENDMGIIGVAPQAQLYPIKVLGDGGQGGFDTIEAGIRDAIELKVDIISMSLGTTQDPPDSLHQAIIEAHQNGIIIVAAAGNDAGAVNYPARYDEVIAVAAIDENGQMARFSSRGEQIAFGAPGVNIYSTYKDNGYAVLNGTSQAAPFISGLCALILTYTRSNPSLPQIQNSLDMLKQLGALCNPNGQITKQGEFGYGIPTFANVDWKKL